MCSARSFSDAEQRGCVAVARRDRPGDRVQLGAAAGALDDRLRRAADEREVAELQEKEVRRRVDAPQRAVELDGRGRGRAGRALRDHDLEDVALADVLLRALDAAEVLLARRLAHERPARAPCRAGSVGSGPVERARVAAQQLGDAARVVEAEEDVGDEEDGSPRTSGPVLRQRHGRLERRDRVVAEVADDRLAERLRLLEGDEPRAGADEAVPPEPPALDRLEQERAARALAQPEVRAERGQEVGCDLGFGHEKGSSRSRVERTGCPGALSVRAGSRRARCARPTGCGRKSWPQGRQALARASSREHVARVLERVGGAREVGRADEDVVGLERRDDEDRQLGLRERHDERRDDPG